MILRLLYKLITTVTKLLAVLLIIALAIILYFGGTNSGQRQLANIISAAVSNEQQTLHLSPIKGLLTGEITVDSIQIINKQSATPWLMIDDAAMHWQPAALLKSTAKINLLTAEKVQLLAPPPSSNTDDSKPFALPQLPLSIYVEDWDFKDIQLSSAIAGQDIKLSTSGLLHIDKNIRDIRLDAQAKREDSIPGNLRANVLFNPDQNALSVDVMAAEPLGGVIAHWLQQAQHSNTTFTLKGAGNLQDWQGKLELLLNNQPHAQLHLRQQQLDTTDDTVQHAIAVSGDLRIADIIARRLPTDSNIQALLSDTTTVDIQSRLTLDSMALEIQTASVSQADWTADIGNGLITTTNISVNDLIISANGAPLSITYADNEVNLRAFTGNLLLTDGLIGASGSLALANLRLGDVVANEVLMDAQTDNLRLSDMSGNITYKMGVSKLDIPDVKLPPIGQKPFDLTGQAQLRSGVIKLDNQHLLIDKNELLLDATLDPNSLDFDAALQALLFTNDLIDNPAIADRIDSMTIKTSLDGNLAAGPTINLHTLSVTSDEIMLLGTAQAVGGALTASLTATAPELQAFSPDIQGPLAATVVASGDVDDLLLELALDSPELNAYSKSVTDITGQATVDLVDYKPSGSLTLTGIHKDLNINLSTALSQKDRLLVANPISAQFGDNKIVGKLQLTQSGTPVGDFKIDFPDLSSLGNITNIDLSGSIVGNISLKTPDREAASNTTTISLLPEISGNLASAQIKSPPVEIRDLSGNFTVHHWQNNQPHIDTNLLASAVTVGSQALTDVTINTKGTLEDWLLNAQIHQPKHTDNPITLIGRLQVKEQQSQFNIESFAGHYSSIPFQLKPDTTITLSPDFALPPTQLDIADGQIQTTDIFSESSDVTIKLANIHLHYLQDFLPPGTDLDGLVNGKIHIAEPRSNPTISTDLSIDNLTVAQLKQQGIQPLATNIKAQYANDILTLDSVRTDNNQGARLLADGTIDLSQQALNVTIDGNIPLAIAQPLLAQQNMTGNGTIDADLQIRGTFTKPDISGKLIGKQLSLTEQQTGISANAIALDISFAGDTVRINQLSSPLSSGGDIRIDGTLGLQSQQLALAVNGNLPVSIADTILAQHRLSADGQIIVDLDIGGVMTNPNLSGHINSQQLNLTDGRSGMQAKDIQLSINLSNNQAVIEQLTAPLSSGGRVSAQGTIGIDPNQGFPIAVEIQFDRANITDGNVLTTTLDGGVSISGTAQQALSVGGSITVGKTDINIPSNLPANIALLNVEHINAPTDILAQDARLAKPSPPSNEDSNILLDVTINAPNQIFITGRGIDAELGGKLTLQGAANNPRTIGGLQIKRGRLNFLEKRLDFTQGNITFAGSLTPLLDLTAERQAADTLITIRVTGQATDPEFTFSSSPELPQSELIAKLLFERSYDDLSAFQIFQLAQATAQLTGAYLGPSLTGQLKQAIGVDDVDIKTDPKTGDTSIEVGKYINDRTYVTVEQGSSPESKRATINLDIGRGVGIRGETNQAGEAKVGIFYEKEY